MEVIRGHLGCPLSGGCPLFGGSAMGGSTVLDRLHQINKTSRARKIDSYDFSTLYTNIPHNALKNNIRSLVREASKISGPK